MSITSHLLRPALWVVTALSAWSFAVAQTLSFASYDIPVPPGYTAPGYISDLTYGPDGAIWFSTYSLVGRLDPTTGSVRVYPASADRIISGPDGALWITKSPGCGIARIMMTGAIVDVPADFGGYCPVALTVGSDHAVWFATSEAIGRIDSSGATVKYPAGTSWVHDLTTGPDGALWYVSSNSYVPAVGRMTSAGTYTLFNWNNAPNAGLIRIMSGPDGALWATGVSNTAPFGTIARITTSGVFTWYSVPGNPDYQAFGGMVTGPDGAIWFTVPGLVWSNPSRVEYAIGRIDMTGGATVYPIPTSYGVTPDHYGGRGIIAGLGGNLWYAGDTNYNSGPLAVGRVVLGQVDATKPASHVTALTSIQTLANFQVQWSGTDVGFGVRDYGVYVSDNGGPFQFWVQTGATQGIFTGTAGHTYGFYSLARDRAGNTEDPKVAAEAVTTIALTVQGDLNGDGAVDCQDVTIVKLSFSKRTGQVGFDVRADVNKDSVVDVRDLAFVMQKLAPGTACH